ncbi:MAG: hypothetical protein ACI309_07150 [Candidatus Limisoma sp.]
MRSAVGAVGGYAASSMRLDGAERGWTAAALRVIVGWDVGGICLIVKRGSRLAATE